jgi:long-chain acyl-CoA synthetase
LTDASQTFARHEILLTGGNGFLGKVILALLLDRYPGFRHLHVLLRPRAERSAEERFRKEVLESPPLREIVQRRAELVQDKVTVWEGDASQPECGLPAGVIAEWRGRLGLILNCAGLVEFFPPVDASLKANADSVVNVLGLARSAGAKLLHVSTCYVAGRADGLVEETEPIVGFYPLRQGLQDRSFDAAAERRLCAERITEIREPAGGGDRPDSETRREIERRLTDFGRERATRWGWVNTYTYSKSIGEQLVAAESAIDWAIVRPAIVESALRFPMPGWIEGGRTAAPLVLMALGGLLDWPVRPDIPLEVVPVDLVAAATLIVGALLLDGKHKPVYQLASADRNPCELGPLVRLLVEEARQRANGSQARRPWWVEPIRRLRFLSPEEARRRRVRLEERIERAERWTANAARAAQRNGLPGSLPLERWSKSLRALSLQASFREQTLEQYLPFVFENRYIFETGNIREAYEQVTEADRRMLPWDPEAIDWEVYWRQNQIGGILRWVQPEAVREWNFRI